MYPNTLLTHKSHWIYGRYGNYKENEKEKEITCLYLPIEYYIIVDIINTHI
jgi:hypothetical protein